jgi:outer membrane lipoprotein-sorting protein
MWHRKLFLTCFLFCFAIYRTVAQDAMALVQKLKAKLEQVSSYEADGIMKTNVSFLKVPEARVKVYFKKPDKIRIKNEKGISLVPKGSVGISLNGLLNGNFTALDAGSVILNGNKVRQVKLLPLDDDAEVVLSTLYIDEAHLLIMKAISTTKENGTYEVALIYGKYAGYALPDKVVCSFNTKDYKLPKGLTFDYDDGSKKRSAETPLNAKGKVEIVYTSYAINKLIPDSVFGGRE